jgi:hypothetical protein
MKIEKLQQLVIMLYNLNNNKLISKIHNKVK